MLDRIPKGVARKGAIAAGLLAAIMAVFVVAGLFMPRSFEVTRSIEIGAPPERVFPLLNELSAWDRWTPWAEIDATLEGPPAGPGARRSWDDPAMGTGSLEIVAADPPRAVDYVVEVEGGALRFEGAFRIEPRRTGGTDAPGRPVSEGEDDSGTATNSHSGAEGALVTWTERAEFGWNPLLGWSASSMERSQGLQMEDSLERLRGAAAGS